jgi:hypothetical protein
LNADLRKLQLPFSFPFVSATYIMADTGILASNHEIPPLDDRTNDATRSQSISSKTLRRTRSSRALYGQLDSSESIPSLHGSIYDADIARSDECYAENEPTTPLIVSPDNIHLRADVPTVLSLEGLDEVPDLPVRGQSPIRSSSLPVAPHPRKVFHPTQLEPIAEQRSLASLRSSLSQARISRSPARNVTIVHPQLSHHSLHPPEQVRESRQSNEPLPSHSTHRRAFSLDDLDCFKFSIFDCPTRRNRESNSSSSQAHYDSLNEKLAQPAAPRRASHAPPERVPTPPGVPSFGSPEAVNYLNPQRARSASWFRLGRSTQTNPPPNLGVNASAAASALAANLNSPPVSPPRSSSWLRSFSLFANDPSSEPPRGRTVSLPPGVLRADDGTYVRGRFGGRVSGHGISSRGLDAHPIQRAAMIERKHRRDPDRLAVPRQRDRPRRQEGERAATSGAGGLGGNDNRSASCSSFLAGLLGWGSGSTQRPEQEQSVPREPRIIDVAQGVDEFLGRSRAGTATAAQPDTHGQPQATTRNPPRFSADTARSTLRNRTPDSKFWHCFRWFCMNCCDMTENELDGCGWYGADRPWVRESRTSLRFRDQRQQEMEARHASWDSISELRRATGGGAGLFMRMRPGGSQGGSQG